LSPPGLASEAQVARATEHLPQQSMLKGAAAAASGGGATASGGGATAADDKYFDAADPRQSLLTLLAGCPTAKALLVSTEPLMREFLEERTPYADGAASPAPAAAASRPPKSPTGKTGSTMSKVRSGIMGASGRSSSSSPPKAAPAPPRTTAAAVSKADFLAACAELPAWVSRLVQGTVIIGNGRTVLGRNAGALIDRFALVVRFNDYVIKSAPTAAPPPSAGAGAASATSVDYSKDIGTKTDLWVVSDWTCAKMLNKYPHRTTVDEEGRERPMPVLIAIPYNFMGKPYYHKRRAELEAELTPEQLARATFVPEEVVKDLISTGRFGDRWPSSGLITIMYTLSTGLQKPHLHGFDFFKEIDGKIHYMEDTHTANHHASEEERICMSLVDQRKVNFLV